jgi:hypothetical protein
MANNKFFTPVYPSDQTRTSKILAWVRMKANNQGRYWKKMLKYSGLLQKPTEEEIEKARASRLDRNNKRTKNKTQLRLRF